MKDWDSPKGVRTTVLVFLGLVVLTALEYLIGISYKHPLVPILPIPIVMAYLMLRFVMRIGDLREGSWRRRP